MDCRSEVKNVVLISEYDCLKSNGNSYLYQNCGCENILQRSTDVCYNGNVVLSFLLHHLPVNLYRFK